MKKIEPFLIYVRVVITCLVLFTVVDIVVILLKGTWSGSFLAPMKSYNFARDMLYSMIFSLLFFKEYISISKTVKVDDAAQARNSVKAALAHLQWHIKNEDEKSISRL